MCLGRLRWYITTGKMGLRVLHIIYAELYDSRVHPKSGFSSFHYRNEAILRFGLNVTNLGITNWKRRIITANGGTYDNVLV